MEKCVLAARRPRHERSDIGLFEISGLDIGNKVQCSKPYFSARCQIALIKSIGENDAFGWKYPRQLEAKTLDQRTDVVTGPA